MNVVVGDVIAEGKTKIIRAVVGEPTLAVLEGKDDITAGDGAKHDVIPGKAGIATRTAANVFALLRDCGLPVAFRKRVGARGLLSERCTMLPFEVVVRREAHGSYLKRCPHLAKGHRFSKLVVEFYLKTKDRTWAGQPIPKDDPLMVFWPDHLCADLFLPDQPLHAQKPFLCLDEYPLRDKSWWFGYLEKTARRAFLALEKAWQLIGRRLVDMKVEFGLNAAGEWRLADVIDNDSWRVLHDGAHIDKQVYRDGGDIASVAKRYREVQKLTAQFGLPRQRIILWRGSQSDNLEPFMKELKPLLGGQLDCVEVTLSMHKSPVEGSLRIDSLTSEVPDAVVIAAVGRSNGVGPTLAANCPVPVITVPVGWHNFPDDVWSSLRAPSQVPVMTVLEPANAALAALHILSAHNPKLYADLRLRQEERLTNAVIID